MHFAMDGEEVKSTAIFSFSNFNEPVDIEVPEEAKNGTSP